MYCLYDILSCWCIVGMHVSSVVDCGFEHESDKNKIYIRNKTLTFSPLAPLPPGGRIGGGPGGPSAPFSPGMPGGPEGPNGPVIPSLPSLPAGPYK